MSESTEAKLLVGWFTHQYPRYKLALIPNEQKLMSMAKNSYAMFNSLIAQGFIKGISDYFLCVPIGKYHGMWLELKDKGKTFKAVSDYQNWWIGDMKIAGYHAAIGYGFDDARVKIEDYLNGY